MPVKKKLDFNSNLTGKAEENQLESSLENLESSFDGFAITLDGQREETCTSTQNCSEDSQEDFMDVDSTADDFLNGNIRENPKKVRVGNFDGYVRKLLSEVRKFLGKFPSIIFCCFSSSTRT
jgi:hypothetical protein